MPGLSVCLLLDERADRAVRGLWRRLEYDGVRTLATYTHGRHVPHLTLASLGGDVPVPVEALAGLSASLPLDVDLHALGVFTRSRCWLLPTVGVDLLRLHESVAGVLDGRDVHRHYRPGAWQPHVTLAPRMPVDALPVVATRVYEVLPLSARLTRMVLVDTGTGEVHDLPGQP
jgi:2'-5' RNA ligase